MNKQKTIIIIVSICTVIVVFLIIVFMKSRGSPDPPICKTEDCIKQDPNSSCVSNECKCNSDYIGTYPNCKIDTSVKIKDQPDQTIQLVNNTSEDPLHIFLGINVLPFTYSSGTGAISGILDFTQKGLAWDPLGSVKVSEVKIPIDKYIILTLPKDCKGPGNAFRVSPMKMKSGNDQFLTINDQRCTSKNLNSGIGTTYCKIAEQWPVLLEGGMDVVADASAVDGINFKLKYQLTAGDKILTMDINQNPCDGLGDKYQLDVGCRNPVKIDCAKTSMADGKDVTADCCTKDQVDNKQEDCISDNQVCRFNDCSLKLFNVPDGIHNNNYHIWDLGNNDPSNKPPVKTFVEDTGHLIEGSPTQKFCTQIHKDVSDFTTYCYDYNDTNSSPTLGSPYKMKLIVSDLV